MPSGERTQVTVRPLVESDIDTAIRVWHVSKQEAYPYLPLEQGRTVEEDGAFFRECILPGSIVWVAETDGEIAGFLALEGDYIDRLYVLPELQRRGVGEALLRAAVAASPSGVWLHTHQQNDRARAFYEKQGFHVVRLGISPPPEGAPDVEYRRDPQPGDATEPSPPTT